jgi:exodeoxyribonuclease-3
VRLLTWNVNGLRAVLDKGAWAWVNSQSPDVACLQEIKARPEQLTEAQHQQFTGYQAFWNPAERPGYSGVATLARPAPLEVSYGLGVPEFDQEGRVICTRYPGFLLYNIYFPNGQRGQDRVDFKLAFYARLLEICDRLHAAGENIIICGDFNTAHREIDLANPKENSKTSGFLPEERVWIDYYLAHGFVDVFRAMYPERVQYTWWTYRFNARKRNIGWRLDYFMVSSAFLPRVKNLVVHDSVPGSDHCPVVMDVE